MHTSLDVRARGDKFLTPEETEDTSPTILPFNLAMEDSEDDITEESVIAAGRPPLIVEHYPAHPPAVEPSAATLWMAAAASMVAASGTVLVAAWAMGLPL